MRQRVSLLKDRSTELEEKLKATIKELEEHPYTIPNIPHESSPAGSAEEDNVEVFKPY